MKSPPFEDALRILADVLERDDEKNRRANKDPRKLDKKAVRRSLEFAAQAYISNKELWSIGPAKVRNRYISMHKAAQKVREDLIIMRREVAFMGPLISTNRETDPAELVKELRLLTLSLDQHLDRLEAGRTWAVARVGPGNLKGSAARNLALNCAGIFKKFTGIEATTATDPVDHKAHRYGDFIDFFSAVLCEIDPDHRLKRVDDIVHKALIERRRRKAE